MSAAWKWAAGAVGTVAAMGVAIGVAWGAADERLARAEESSEHAAQDTHVMGGRLGALEREQSRAEAEREAVRDALDDVLSRLRAMDKKLDRLVERRR